MDAAVFGNIVADVIGRPIDLNHPIRPGALQFIDSIVLESGGNVCNVAMAMSRLGMSVAGVGCVGDDVLGRALLERLKTAGVETSAVITSAAAPTSATIVALQPDGQRSFYHASGATDLLKPDLFRKAFNTFRSYAWIQIGYFGLLNSLTADLPQLLGELKQIAPGAKIALDTVDPPADRKLLDPILPHLALFAPSRAEAEALSGQKEPKKMIASFRKQMPQGIIGIKLGAEGCCLDDGQQYVRIPAIKTKVVDTTGAGDTWHAGLLTALRKGMPLEQCGQFANRVAADCCSALGASAGIRTFDETMARI